MRKFQIILVFGLLLMLMIIFSLNYIVETRQDDDEHKFIRALNKKENQEVLKNWIDKNVISNPILETEVVHVIHLPIGDYIFREELDCTEMPADLCVDHVVLIGEPENPIAVGFLPGTGRSPIIYLISEDTSVHSISIKMGDSARIEEIAPRFYRITAAVVRNGSQERKEKKGSDAQDKGKGKGVIP